MTQTIQTVHRETRETARVQLRPDNGLKLPETSQRIEGQNTTHMNVLILSQLRTTSYKTPKMSQ